MGQEKNNQELIIEFCMKCNWLPRACWMAQEIMNTFSDEVTSVRLKKSGSGTYKIHVLGEEVFCREKDAGFIEMKKIKRRIRDVISPGKELGHSEK